MTNQEFSDEFDILYNNITSNQAPGLDEYEKSVVLTKAQDEILKAYFNPRLNKTQEGFDDNEKRQIDFSMILFTQSYLLKNGQLSSCNFDNKPNSKRVILSKDIMMFINEFVDVVREGKNDLRLSVVPINYKEYARLMSKPYKRPLQYQAWRLLDNTGGTNGAELIVGPNDVITGYVIRYIKRPNPIILSDLEGVSINGMDKESPCELDPILHPEILQRAVELAKAAWAGDLTSTLALGANSETNMGVVSAQK